MKKLLVALVATSMVASAFAADGENMVRFMNMDQAGENRSFDLSMNGDDAENETKSTHIALNYARAFGQWQVGVAYRSLSGETSGTETGGSSIGLSGYYNLESDLGNTCYFGLHLMQHKASDGSYSFQGSETAIGEDDAAQTIALEYGHRWHLAEAWGLHLTYSPSVMYSMTSFEWDNEANDDTQGTTETALAWNWLKFDVMF